MTMSGVPEKHRSLTPELRRSGSFDGGGTDTETFRTSPAACLPDNTIEHLPAQSLSPGQASAAGLPNTSSDHDVLPAVESLHSDRDNIHITVETSSQHPDAASSRPLMTEAETLHSGKKKKKKKRHSSPATDESHDVKQAAVKESSRKRHKDRSHGAGQTDDVHRSLDAGSRENVSDNVDDQERRQTETAEVSKHKLTVETTVDSENTVDKKKKKKRKSNENLSSKSLVDDDGRAKTGDGGAKTVRQYSYQESSENLSSRSLGDDDSRAKTGDGGAKTVRQYRHQESSENLSSRSLGDDDSRAKTGDSNTKSVRQYRHQDGIHERTCRRTAVSRRKHEKTPVSALNQLCVMLATLATNSLDDAVFCGHCLVYFITRCGHWSWSETDLIQQLATCNCVIISHFLITAN